MLFSEESQFFELEIEIFLPNLDVKLSNYNLWQFRCFSVPYQSPLNVSVASVSDTYIDITWDHPSLSPETWNIFQGYEVYLRRAGTTQINVSQVNEPVNFITLTGLEPLVTYEVSVAAYTLTGVGKKSDSIAVNTTFGKVVFKCVFKCVGRSAMAPSLVYSPPD